MYRTLLQSPSVPNVPGRLRASCSPGSQGNREDQERAIWKCPVLPREIRHIMCGLTASWSDSILDWRIRQGRDEALLTFSCPGLAQDTGTEPTLPRSISTRFRLFQRTTRQVVVSDGVLLYFKLSAGCPYIPRINSSAPASVSFIYQHLLHHH